MLAMLLICTLRISSKNEKGDQTPQRLSCQRKSHQRTDYIPAITIAARVHHVEKSVHAVPEVRRFVAQFARGNIIISLISRSLVLDSRGSRWFVFKGNEGFAGKRAGFCIASILFCYISKISAQASKRSTSVTVAASTSLQAAKKDAEQQT